MLELPGSPMRHQTYSGIGDGRESGTGANASRLSKKVSQSSVQLLDTASEEEQDEHVATVTRLRKNLSTESSMVVLDVIEVFMHDFFAMLGSAGAQNELMDHVFQVLTALLTTNQSKHLLVHLFATLQGVVNKFHKVLFQGSTEYCAEVCEAVFRYCSSPIKETRETASAFLYLLMRKNFEDKDSGPGFSRVKVQATIALSQIVDSDDFVTDKFLRKSLATIIK